MPRFWRNILSPSSALKIETVCFSEMLASTDESTRCKNPEEQRHHVRISQSVSLTKSVISEIFDTACA
jgi:hypothetical protein